MIHGHSTDLQITPIIWYSQFRERKYPLHFDNNIADALFRANCQKSGNRKDRKVSKAPTTYMGMDIENQISEAAFGPEKNRKRDVRDWQRGEERGFRQNAHNAPGESSVLRRGDIPVIHGDCDGKKNCNCLGKVGGNDGQFLPNRYDDSDISRAAGSGEAIARRGGTTTERDRLLATIDRELCWLQGAPRTAAGYLSIQQSMLPRWVECPPIRLTCLKRPQVDYE